MICHYYGEESPGGLQAHLDECRQCSEEFSTLKRAMAAVDSFAAPNPPPDFEERTWRAIVQRDGSLAGRAAWWRRLLFPKRLMWAGGLAAMVIGAFLAGRLSITPRVTETAAAPEAVRERLLVAALSDHLEQSERLLLEIDNSELNDERQVAENLLAANRLYRQTAALEGKSSLATTLDDLERVLTDVAHAPDRPTAAQVRQLQARIEDQQLLFKVQMLGQRLRQLNQQPIERKG
ncbi:MAG: hypothetical protein HY820_39070 [Acidobacteria bacterium]|nr:hypothetical protein [Acidobacteriota bacterium]